MAGRAHLVFIGSGEAGPWVSAVVFLRGALAVPRHLLPFPLAPTDASLLVAPNLGRVRDCVVGLRQDSLVVDLRE
ncbi:hypothetical protein QYE76_059166 [Lolium multiflorum]|uniref:Uncharacterized protein n=1 Tax=Lolium multiflorum TaxID=4521 RepID=A0AAD8PH45_LOLMU|nr:hypothetical protein QYE76_059166 [Lolium multiflorum]